MSSAMGRLFFDYSTMVRWHGRPTGIPRTVERLAHSFKAVNPETVFISIDEELQGFRNFDLETCQTGAVVEFESGDRVFSCGANWAFACYNPVVRGLVASGVDFYQLFYDMIPSLFPHFYEQAEGYGNYMGSWTRETLELVKSSFAISEATRQDVYAWTGVSPESKEIAVVRLGDELDALESVDEGEVEKKFGYLGDFILSVGTLELRKNHAALLNAYRLLDADGKRELPNLVIVGRPGWLNNSLEFQCQHDPAIKGKVFVLSDISDGELDYLYRKCQFTVFPSLYEGWGLPIAESLRYGKQCVASSTSSMVEIAPNLVRFAHPLKPDEWASHIFELASNRTMLASENELIGSTYTGSTWDACARTILHKLIEQ
ncbi:glycosyltransferase family 4 protein [Burkholderia ubonensis]|uniref:glycosyltransferase family 4 protein n=1 Tax=Burkholderia ubonensis TaxID=101571 RepID=UPI001E4BD353|nr:glycosyltransferase family 1 protein [Burkholderia ubonensis]